MRIKLGWNLIRLIVLNYIVFSKLKSFMLYQINKFQIYRTARKYYKSIGV